MHLTISPSSRKKAIAKLTSGPPRLQDRRSHPDGPVPFYRPDNPYSTFDVYNPPAYNPYDVFNMQIPRAAAYDYGQRSYPTFSPSYLLPNVVGYTYSQVPASAMFAGRDEHPERQLPGLYPAGDVQPELVPEIPIQVAPLTVDRELVDRAMQPQEEVVPFQNSPRFQRAMSIMKDQREKQKERSKTIEALEDRKNKMRDDIDRRTAQLEEEGPRKKIEREAAKQLLKDILNESSRDPSVAVDSPKEGAEQIAEKTAEQTAEKADPDLETAMARFEHCLNNEDSNARQAFLVQALKHQIPASFERILGECLKNFFGDLTVVPEDAKSARKRVAQMVISKMTSFATRGEQDRLLYATAAALLAIGLEPREFIDDKVWEDVFGDKSRAAKQKPRTVREINELFKYYHQLYQTETP